MSEPSQLRTSILQTRNQQSPDEILKKSQLISDRLLDLEPMKSGSMVFIYISFRSEVETMSLLRRLLAAGKDVCVPITRVAEKRLDAVRITNPDTELEPGYCNIPEPREEICKKQLVHPTEIDTIILPGSVFDERGGRFGYGGGFYDRFVSAVPAARRIGLAFELQMVQEAPLQDHDELLDYVVTEKRVIHSARIR